MAYKEVSYFIREQILNTLLDKPILNRYDRLRFVCTEILWLLYSRNN